MVLFTMTLRTETYLILLVLACLGLLALTVTTWLCLVEPEIIH